MIFGSFRAFKAVADRAINFIFANTQNFSSRANTKRFVEKWIAFSGSRAHLCVFIMLLRTFWLQTCPWKLDDDDEEKGWAKSHVSNLFFTSWPQVPKLNEQSTIFMSFLWKIEGFPGNKLMGILIICKKNLKNRLSYKIWNFECKNTLNIQLFHQSHRNIFQVKLWILSLIKISLFSYLHVHHKFHMI